MPQPTPYSRTFSFTEDEAANPLDRTPGDSLDTEFDNVGATLAGVLANLARLQRDDGALKNGIVTLDSFSPSALATLGASDWTVRGQWAAATNYTVGDVVMVGTATHVAAAAHLANANFEVDRAAGRWVRIYDDASSIPDGTIVAAMIADGAITAAKIGFTALDLTGSIRGQGGIAAGTAPAGALMHAKKDAGDVHVKVERATADQGAVGYQIVGVGATWTMQMAAGNADVQLTRDGVVTVTYGDKLLSVAGAARATGADPTTGAGVHLSFAADIGYLVSRDYTANAWRDLRARAKDFYVESSGVVTMKSSATGVDFPLGLSNNGVAVGYLGIPNNQQNAAYAIVAADNGKCIYSENVAAQAITVPALSTDAAVLVINDGSSSITLQQNGVTLVLAGSGATGNRTVAADGMAFIKWVKAGRAYVYGPGVS